ncbi:unnamed protein product [Tetraodon nigroviridis]|uniref:(spotted green pufferfish) hypothetical protein n=1 Tax=Tetraodon nigroviridis TaxID=99883 RepID=Q4SP86_TETNG|nr:unnamed protein product [Tetraodon nigroviridis]
MDNLQKRNLTFGTIGLLFLLSGIEYAVILPTIWRYLQVLEAPPYFLGLGLSAFSLSALLTGPLFGFWSDRSGRTKSIVLFSNLFEIAGNFMYFVGYSKWLLLCSRLVAGVGAGAGSSVFGFLTRSTRPEERAAIFAAVMACRQVGLLVGPAFNLFLRLCDFKVGPFVVNKYTSPGVRGYADNPSPDAVWEPHAGISIRSHFPCSEENSEKLQFPFTTCSCPTCSSIPKPTLLSGRSDLHVSAVAAAPVHRTGPVLGRAARQLPGGGAGGAGDERRGAPRRRGAADGAGRRAVALLRGRRRRAARPRGPGGVQPLQELQRQRR